MKQLPISADSHITDPHNCYRDHIEAAYRERAPHIERDPKYGDVYVVEGMKQTIPMGLVAAAGVEPSSIRVGGAHFEDLHRGGGDPAARLADQNTDGAGAEVIYPTVGMVLCNHPDVNYRKACFDAYNRWILRFHETDPKRLVMLPQVTLRTVSCVIEQVHFFCRFIFQISNDLSQGRRTIKC